MENYQINRLTVSMLLKCAITGSGCMCKYLKCPLKLGLLKDKKWGTAKVRSLKPLTIILLLFQGGTNFTVFINYEIENTQS